MTATPNPFSDTPNPYAPPSAAVIYALPDGSSSGGLWRQKNLLVMQRQALLPAVCVKSNEPATQTLTRKLQYLTPWLVLLAFISLPIFAVVALFAMKRVTITIGLTDEWIEKRRFRMLLAWGFGLAGAFAIGLGVMQLQPDFQIALDDDTNAILVGLALGSGIVLALVGLLIGAYGCRLIHAKKIDDNYLWIKGVHPGFLDRLPEWPGL